jgi:AbiV family abortive infection protein
VSLPTKLPDRTRTFFEVLFGQGDQQRLIALIADAFPVILDHVGALLADTDCLVRGERFARAHFLIATADEELGKCHLLLDCARLDIHKHQSDLKKLSETFYDHIAKYAYMKLWRLGQTTKTFWWWNMEEALRIFNSDRVRFWKATSASIDEPPTEPDMPHNTYFHRERNLYVDINDLGEWWVSPPSYGCMEFDKSMDRYEVRAQTEDHLRAFEKLRVSGALTEHSLQAMNVIWRGQYVNRSWKREQLNDIWRRTAESAAKVCTSTGDDLLNSPLCFWPCYYALQTRPEQL